jgi:probable phosphoglycerate mutase
VAVEITLVRHGETVANVAGLWQGAGNSGFSPRGREQVKRLAHRLDREHFDLVVVSPSGRAAATAGATRFDAESDERWREMELGAWEGLSREEVEERYADDLAAFRAGEDVPAGGSGERASELGARALAAMDSLVERLEDGQRALVVSHGGPVMLVTAALLGLTRRGPLHPILNTAITRVRYADGRYQLTVFNDTSHLNGYHSGFHGDTQVVLIRHGQTESNLESRWQGRQHGMLTAEGRDQARRLASVVPAVDGLYSSPLGRALDTAAEIAGRLGIDVTQLDDLAEMSFGRWENLTSDEIMKSFPEEWERFQAGHDVPRGGNGETFGDAGRRLASAVEAIADRHPAGVAGAVTHGGVSRAYVAHLLGTSFLDRHRLPLLDNTAMTRIVMSERGPLLADYNVAPHLL